MRTIKPHQYDPESWDDDDEDSEGFERIRKQTEKPVTQKGERRQRQKEFGRAIRAFHKQRDRSGKP